MHTRITQADTFEEPWLSDVGRAVTNAFSLAFDGCHKIYIVRDEITHQTMIDLDYAPVRVTCRSDAVDQLFEWWEISCPLRFIQAVEHGAGDDEHFTCVIPQGQY